MRSLVLLLLLTSVAAAKPRVLVLPLPDEDPAASVFDARLVVALDEAGVTAVTPTEEPTCLSTECLADLGKQQNAEQVLSMSLVREERTFTLFATLVDVASRTAARRTELTGLDSASLGKRAPAELARFVSPKKRETFVIGVAIPASGVAHDAALSLADRLGAAGFVARPIDKREDRTNLTHRAELAITKFSIERRVHHVHHYLDGVMTVTLTVTDLATREVTFTRSITVTASQRARKSSATEVTAQLVAAAIDQCIAAFNAAGRNG